MSVLTCFYYPVCYEWLLRLQPTADLQMSIATNITRRSRSARYYARVAVPTDLRNVIGRRELWKSLGTTDPREAKQKVRAVLEAWDVEFAERRKRRTVSEADIQEAVWSRYLELTVTDERFRSSLPTENDLDEIWRELVREFGDYDLWAYRVFQSIRDRLEADQGERAARRTTLRQQVARGETKVVDDVTQRALDQRRLEAAKGSPEYRQLAQGLQRAELEALDRAAERDAGDFGGQPRDALVKPPAAQIRASVAAPGESVMELFDAYARENPKSVKPDTLNQSRMAVDLFAGTLPPRFPASSINKKAVREWKALLLQYPVKAAETAVFRRLSMREVINANSALARPKPPISDKTVNRYLSGLGAFCDWLVIHDYLHQNPVADMHKRIDKTIRTTTPYTVEQLQKVFTSPLFTGCASDEKMHIPGHHRIRDHRYWLPLIMLFSGARPAEIAQLLTDDVHKVHGHWVMHITS
jgi:hypothetical protein